MSDLIDGLSEGLANAGETILSFLPRLIGALVILFVGWLVARLVHRVFQRVFKVVGLDTLLERADSPTDCWRRVIRLQTSQRERSTGSLCLWCSSSRPKP